jgi:hypothetical protein
MQTARSRQLRALARRLADALPAEAARAWLREAAQVLADRASSLAAVTTPIPGRNRRLSAGGDGSQLAERISDELREASLVGLVDPALDGMRLPPSVHDEGDHGFVATLVDIARDKGVSGYIGDGTNRWPAVHLLDAARLFRLALETAPAGSVLHGVADQGVPVRAIAEVIRRHLDHPVVAIAPEDAGEHFGWPASWRPTSRPRAR